MAHGPVVARRVAILPIAVAVVGAWLDALRSAGQMQLADQTAVVTRIGECARHQLWSLRKVFETVAVNMHRAGIHTGEETGAARRANRALTIGVGEGRTRGDQAIDIGRRHTFVSQSGDRIVALLVGANPENIWRHILGLVIINEINYNSSNEFDPGDWVELYNSTDEILNIGNWTFKDGDDSHVYSIPENTFLLPDNYLVLCSDTNSFTSLFPVVQKFEGNLGFSFSGSGEMLRLYNTENTLIDRVNYVDSDPWPTAPDGNGPTLELIDPLSDNGSAENWRASEENGSPTQSNN